MSFNTMINSVTCVCFAWLMSLFCTSEVLSYQLSTQLDHLALHVSHNIPNFKWFSQIQLAELLLQWSDRSQHTDHHCNCPYSPSVYISTARGLHFSIFSRSLSSTRGSQGHATSITQAILVLLILNTKSGLTASIWSSVGIARSSQRSPSPVS